MTNFTEPLYLPTIMDHEYGPLVETEVEIET